MNSIVFHLHTNGFDPGNSVLELSSVIFSPQYEFLSFFDRFYFPEEPLLSETTMLSGYDVNTIAWIRRSSGVEYPRYFLEDLASFHDWVSANNISVVYLFNADKAFRFLPKTFFPSIENIKIFDMNTAMVSILRRPGEATEADSRHISVVRLYNRLIEEVKIFDNPQKIRHMIRFTSALPTPKNSSLGNCFRQMIIASLVKYHRLFRLTRTSFDKSVFVAPKRTSFIEPLFPQIPERALEILHFMENMRFKYLKNMIQSKPLDITETVIER